MWVTDAAPIRPLARELPYVAGVALKFKKKKNADNSKFIPVPKAIRKLKPSQHANSEGLSIHDHSHTAPAALKKN